MIPILLYHSVSDQVSSGFRLWSISPPHFAEQMSYLKQTGYHPITILQLVQILTTNPGLLPKNVIVITFDDGFRDFLTGALPVLQALRFPSTLYIPAGYVGKTSLWLSREGEANRPLLDWEDLCAIHEAGVEVGAHSLTHPQLDTLSVEAAWKEVRLPKEIMEQRLGWSIDSFAYPHGYYSYQVRQDVIRSGYSSAAGVKNAMSGIDDDIYSLSRMTITSDVTLERFVEMVHGVRVRHAPKVERFQTTMWRVFRKWRHENHPTSEN